MRLWNLQRAATSAELDALDRFTQARLTIIDMEPATKE
jgi:hypothetical protein